MKKDSFLNFIIRNKYVILFVAIVLILAFTGVLGKIIEILFVLLLLIGAVYLGKRIQEDERFISHIFRKRKDEITYTIRDDDSK